MTDAEAAPLGEVEFEFEGETFTMVFDWGALALYERTMSELIMAIFGELERYQIAIAAKASNLMRYAPRMSAVAALVKAGLSTHHPDVSFDLAMRMFADPAVQAALGTAGDASMGGGEPGAGEPKPAATKTGASTGTKSSRAGSKRAARSNNSGARRPASR